MSIQTVSVEEDGLIKLSDESEKVEEVKAEVAAEEVTTEEETTEESDELAAAGEEETEEVKPKKKGGFQKKLERKDREIEALRAELAAKQTAPKEAVSFDKAKPKIDDFDSHSEFTEALADWKFDQREVEKTAQAKKTEVMSEVQQAVSKYETALKELKKTTPDLDDVFEEVAHIRPCPALQEAIITSELNAQLAYELAKNPEEYERINKLSPLLVAKEIGKLELRLSKTAEEKSAKTKEENKTTKAPAPLKSLAGKSVIATATKSLYDSENMDFKEWNRLREAELKKAQKRA